MAKKARVKPAKPYAKYPLYAHASGQWAKRIGGKVHYFGAWADPAAAAEEYERQSHFLHFGKTPPPRQDTVADLIDEFLAGKEAAFATADIGQQSLDEYHATCEVIRQHFGRHRPIDSLTVQDFNDLRVTLAKGKCKCQQTLRLDKVRLRMEDGDYWKLRETLAEGKNRYRSRLGEVTIADAEQCQKFRDRGWKWGDIQGLKLTVTKQKCECDNTLSPVTLKRRLTVARMIFADQPRAFRKALKSPPQRLLRAEARKRGLRMYESDDIRKLVKAAEPHMRAMILLGINCGFGPQDCYTLPVVALDLKNGWQVHARPKTEVERRCPLWPETVNPLHDQRSCITQGIVLDRRCRQRQGRTVRLQ